MGGGGGANYWAPLTRKRHTMPHSAQPQHTNYWAPLTRKRHQQEHRPQRPTERSDPTQHAKGRTGPVKKQQPDGMSHRGCPTAAPTPPPPKWPKRSEGPVPIWRRRYRKIFWHMVGGKSSFLFNVFFLNMLRISRGIQICMQLTPDLPHPAPPTLAAGTGPPGGKFSFFKSPTCVCVQNDQCDEGIVLSYRVRVRVSTSTGNTAR